MPDRARVIQLNDQLRTAFKGGKVRVTPSVYELDARLCGRALYAMSRSLKFDPNGEHDSGRFVFAGYLFEWCIVYRNVNDGAGISADPADPRQTRRVLTLSAVEDLFIREHSDETLAHHDRPLDGA